MSRKRKGQLVFEFVIASLILFSVIFYTINFISSDFNLRHNRFLSDRLEGNAIRVSDILLSNNQNGLTSGWPLLDQDRIDEFMIQCGDYIGTLKEMGLKEEAPYVRYIHMNVTVTDSSPQTYLSCGRSPPENAAKAVVTRFALSPGNRIARIDVTLW